MGEVTDLIQQHLTIDGLCPIGHSGYMKVKIRLIEYFTTSAGKQPARIWLDGIKDKLTQAILYKRIRQAGLGNFGSAKSVGNGVSELKVDYGPGYRIYYGIHKDEVILLLMGGSKRTQQADIDKAKNYWEQWQEEHDEN